jgi:hypothetical protein
MSRFCIGIGVGMIMAVASPMCDMIWHRSFSLRKLEIVVCVTMIWTEIIIPDQSSGLRRDDIRGDDVDDRRWHCPGFSEIATNNNLVGPRSYDVVPARQRHVIKYQSAIHIGKRAHRTRHLQQFHPSGVRTTPTILDTICLIV